MSGLDRLQRRMEYYGGDADARNVKGKLRSMLAAQRNSYQAENIEFNNKTWRCLINPSKLSEDYDRKFISIIHESEMKEGSVFYWPRTGKYWIASQRQYTEEAYFRSLIDVCDYEIDVNKNKYWVYLRGPIETSLNWTSKHNLHVNNLNYTLIMKVTKNEETLEFFTRFKVIKFEGHNWQVVATDKYSQEGIIEVYLDEYYDNIMEDNMIIPEIKKPDIESKYIDGELYVYPYDTKTYTIQNLSGGQWEVSDPKVAKITTAADDSCEVEILSKKSGAFVLYYKTEDEVIENKIQINPL